MDKRKLKVNINIYPDITIKLHDYDDNSVVSLGFESIGKIKSEKGKTVVFYADTPLDTTSYFYAKETVEEINELVDEAKYLYGEIVQLNINEEIKEVLFSKITNGKEYFENNG